ncbi:hypothetical protein K1719_034800 [Acacia pycnantha]|nr:hypothetical protein K1719_034800 [Acacia pycnantha]
MGLPFGDKGIEIKVTNQNPVFRDFRNVYKNVKYKTLGDTLLGKLDENFEYLFVLFTLGTLLAPSASIYVSDHMLKVMTLTKDALGDFDWSSFILEELNQQIYEFNKDSHKSKGNKSKTDGGCIYFLMLFCLQNFALGDVITSEHELAMAYWTHDKVKSRVVLEKKSQKGLPTRASRSQPSVTPSASFHPHTMLTHPPSSSMESEKDDEKERDEEDEAENIEDIDDDDDHHHDTTIDVEPIEEDIVEEVAKPEAQEGEQSDEQIRRSKRVITRNSVLKSPWIDPNRKCKGKRPYDEKEQLEFVDMNGWHLQRAELDCLKPRAWINDMVMSTVAKTLVADQLENRGTVTRHIFNAHFMHKIISSPQTWSLQANEAKILPERIGYNIGDCHFMFGPSLMWYHWFCYVVDTTTMTFYALDLLVDTWTYSRM